MSICASGRGFTVLDTTLTESRVKAEKSGKHNFTIDFTILGRGKKLWLK